MSAKASNAVLAKARAMYGKCLKERDYQQLIECRTVPEVAAYLKTQTCYADVLSGLNETETHRGQLETLLRQEMYLNLFSLSRYAADQAGAVADYLTAQLDIEQIMRCLMLLNIGKPEEFLLTVPLSLDKYTKLSLSDMAEVRTYDDLLTLLAHTAYEPVLKSFRPAEGEKIDIPGIELALHNKVFSAALEATERLKNKTDRKELKELLHSMFDFENLERILRLKKYHGFGADTIRRMLIPYGKLSSKTIEELCQAEDIRDIYELARATYLGRTLSRLKYHDNTQVSDALINAYCKHHLRLSPNPIIVMISYLYLKQIEIHNIINLVEATRYGMPTEAKQKLPVR